VRHEAAVNQGPRDTTMVGWGPIEAQLKGVYILCRPPVG
jgi:hypothetical protein